MPYVFTIILLISLILLVVGLINPEKALFWSKGERSKKRSSSTYGLVALAATIGIAITVPGIKKEEKTIAEAPVQKSKETAAPPTTAVPAAITTSFDYELPASEYKIPVMLGNIEAVNKKEAFLIKEGEYVPATKKEGYLLSLSFTLTNNYDKELLVPVPADWYLAAADDKFFTDQQKWNRSCECYTTDIAAVKIEGVDLDDYTSTRCGAAGNYCVPIKPGQVIHGKTEFLYPVLASVRKLILHAFGRNAYENRKMAYDKGWPIDVDAKTFGTEILIK